MGKDVCDEYVVALNVSSILGYFKDGCNREDIYVSCKVLLHLVLLL